MPPKLKELLAKLADALKPDPAERDENQVAACMTAMADYAETDEAKGYEPVGELKTAIDQLRKDLDAQTKMIRDAQRMGLGVRGGRIIVRGRRERLDMLADQRAFMDDEQAKRFGAHMAVTLARCKRTPFGVDDLPKYTRDVAKDVAESAVHFKADADISPDIAGAGQEFMSNEFRAELIRDVEAAGTAFVLLNRVPLATFGTTTYPKRTSGLTAYPTAIAAKIAQSGIGTETVTLSPVQWGTLTGIPLIMFYDPGMLVDVGQLTGTEIVYAMSDAWDNSVINGDGSADYGGITGMLESANISAVAPTADHDAMGEIDATDVGEITAGLTVGYAWQRAQWLMSLSVKSNLRNIRSTTGMPIYDRGQGDREPASIDGYPYSLCTRMPAAGSVAAGGAFALFGDFRLTMFFGMLRQLAIDTSEHVWFDSAMVAIRGLAYVDAEERNPDAAIKCALHA